MAWPRRGGRERLADDPRLVARLPPGERLLAAASTESRTDPGEEPREVVGGSALALYLPGGVVLGWHEIEQATWHLDESRLDVFTLPIDGPARSYQIHLPEPGRLPELVRERVTSSIVVNQHVPLVGRRGVKIIARRVPENHELDWIVVYDPTVDGDDPAVRQRVLEAVDLLRRNLGI